MDVSLAATASLSADSAGLDGPYASEMDGPQHQAQPEGADLSGGFTCLEAVKLGASAWARGMAGNWLLQQPQRLVDGLVAQISTLGGAHSPRLAALEASAVHWAALTREGNIFQRVFWGGQVVALMLFMAGCATWGMGGAGAWAAQLWSLIHLARSLQVLGWLARRDPKAAADRAAAGTPLFSNLCFTPMLPSPTRDLGLARRPPRGGEDGERTPGPPAPSLEVEEVAEVDVPPASPSSSSSSSALPASCFIPGMAVWDWLEALLFVPPCLMLLGDFRPAALLMLAPCELAVGWHALLHALLPALVRLPLVAAAAAFTAPLLVAGQLVLLPACAAWELLNVVRGGRDLLQREAARLGPNGWGSDGASVPASAGHGGGRRRGLWHHLSLMEAAVPPVPGLGPEATPAEVRARCCVEYYEVEEEEEEAGRGRCSICLEGVVEGCSAAKPPCQHVFHAACMDAWMVAVASGRTPSARLACPLCKHDLLNPLH